LVRFQAQVIGRDADVATVERWLGMVADGPRALLVEGDIGIGKTSFWHEAVSLARGSGFRVIAASPAEADRDLAFAVIGDLFRDVPDALWSELPGPQRRALRVALLQADPADAPAEPHAIGLAVLSLLRAVGRPGPLLVAIDDTHWVDRPSLRALQFAVRRLIDEPIALLLAARSPDPRLPYFQPRDFLDTDRVESLRLGPMSLEAIDELLTHRLAAAFSKPTLRQLHQVSGGNPFFALEIGRLLLMHGVRGLPGDPLPIPGSVSDLVKDRIQRLPAKVADLLFTMSAVARPTEAALARIIGHDHELFVSLQAALDHRLVEFAGERIRFTHPLIGSVVYAEASPNRRRELHRRLAGIISDEDEQSRHLAAATAVPDEAVARRLDEAGRHADGRGAPDAAAAFFLQAAAITPPDNRKRMVRRSIAAADALIRAGETVRARGLLEGLVDTPSEPLRARVLHRLAKVRFAEEGVQPAMQLLLDALASSRDDQVLRAALERDLVMVMLQAGNLRDAAAHAATLRALAEGIGDDALLSDALVHESSVEFVLGGEISSTTVDRAMALAERAISVGGHAHPGIFAPEVMWGTWLKWTDAFADARNLYTKTLERLSERQDESLLEALFFHLGELEVWAGDWARAENYARRGEAVSRQSSHHARRHLQLTIRGMIDAHLGRIDAARTVAREALTLSERLGDVQFRMRNLRTLGFLELSVGDLRAASDHLRELNAVFDRYGYGQPGIIRFHADAVEVLVDVGELAEATRITQWLEERSRIMPQPWSRVMASRCRALLLMSSGDLPAGLIRLEQAIWDHAALSQPFELGRTLMLQGIGRRRAKQKRAARESLEAALQIFDSLGIRPWTTRAQSELLRLGKRRTEPGRLTPTEVRVSELVAAGHTNQEVASRLFISVKTVEASLSRIYQKLEVRSRAQLAAKLSVRGKD
jgi:DNA-binding CsgD family transcriptional regulator